MNTSIASLPGIVRRSVIDSDMMDGRAYSVSFLMSQITSGVTRTTSSSPLLAVKWVKFQPGGGRKRLWLSRKSLRKWWPISSPG